MGQPLLNLLPVRFAVLGLTAAAFFFGFLETLTGTDFERLHIFLFNLCAGGFTIILYAGGSPDILRQALLFFLLSIIYAVSAFLKIYPVSIACALLLFLLIESHRVRRFGFFPYIFFKIKSDTAEKFRAASLLCLSTALLFSAVVIINSEYLKLFTIPKLTLNVFFLGFSFPVSLITMSVMFSFVKSERGKWELLYEHLFFWVINLGVILFFVFILLEAPAPEGISAGTLCLAVLSVFFYFRKHAGQIQQKKFLQSGILFLLSTAVTGVAYIIMKFSSAGYDEYGQLLLKSHAYLSLYGWNLSGLLVILRWKDFPIKINTSLAVAAHWLIIAVLAPLSWKGIIHPLIAPAAFTGFLVLFFIGKNEGDNNI
jgi:hypothetical protein